MAYMTVHMDRTGLLKSMDLDNKQADGELCALCGTASGTSEIDLRRIGRVVGTNRPVVICRRCRVA